MAGNRDLKCDFIYNPASHSEEAKTIKKVRLIYQGGQSRAAQLLPHPLKP